MESQQLRSEHRWFGPCLDIREEARERRPGERVVHRAESIGDEIRIRERNELTGNGIENHVRFRPQTRGERRETGGSIAGKCAIWTAVIAETEELFERGCGSRVAPQPRREWKRRTFARRAGRPGHRVEHTIDDERAEPVGEEVRIRHAQVRAVRVANVGEQLVVNGLAQQIQIARDVSGRHVIDDAGRALIARVDKVLVRRLPHPFLRRGDGEWERREETRPLAGAAKAAHRGASRNAARVEAHQIEPRTQRLRDERRDAEQEVDAGSSGSARIEEE
jgi:hypothetical protein